ncbi:hypothetical protein RND71_040844 [Anisodus tanguticus]|uniref:Cyclic nucleotide-binding domain-containing protein n=1 Tax=Anisodus tanguticus TaxID=243964 RepID=A0AAE1UQM3_9SOLA|nr:hypothetical protein RND71_040844 [Anisodus tanguticus]
MNASTAIERALEKDCRAPGGGKAPGTLLTITTNGGITGFFNSASLKAGDFCGEVLLTWALDLHTSPSLPASTRTVHAVTDAEAFALTADDLKFVATQFRRLHSKQLRHTFKYVTQFQTQVLLPSVLEKALNHFNVPWLFQVLFTALEDMGSLLYTSSMTQTLQARA